MKETKFFGIGVTLVALMTLLLICNIAAAQIIPGRYIVVFRDDVVDPLVAAAAIARANGLALDHTYSFALKGFAAVIPKARLNAVVKDRRVAYIEPDLEVHILQQTLPTGIDRIDADLNATAKIDGIDERVDVDVAIIDTGIDGDHPDLNVVGGVNFARGPSWKWDDGYGHGTHVAGTVAALDNGFGVVGVAPGARLWAVKVLNDLGGTGQLSDVIEGVDWVTQHADTIEVVNMSLGTKGRSDSFRTAIQNSVAADVVYFVAAGNSSMDVYGDDGIFNTDDDQIPGGYPEVATISAMADSDGQPGGTGDPTSSGDDDSFASFSNFSNSDVNQQEGVPVTSPGAAIDLLMPGADIYSTHKDGRYATMSGTSMSTPHASGLAALYIAVNGRATDAAGVYAIRQALIDGGMAQDSPQGLAALNDPDSNWENIGWAGPLDSTPPAKVTGLTVTTVSCAQLDLAWDANTEIDLHHYNVYRSTTSGGPYDLIASPTTNSYSDTGLTASTTYYYVASAVDTSGNEGEASDEASGTTSADDLGPVTSNVVADPNPTNGTSSVALTADVSDSTTGNSNIVAAEYFVDAVGANGSGTPMSASDGTFDSPTEGVTASIDVSGWTVGQYTLYIHGQDAVGNWGATESVVLDVTEASSNIMYVESITFSSKVAGPNKFLYTTVKVADGSGNPLSDVGVEMTLDWDKEGDGIIDDSWNFAGNTGTDGTIKFTLGKAPAGYHTATVTNLTLTGYTWDTTKGVTSASCELKDDGTVIQGAALAPALVSGFKLLQNVPNPFNPDTWIPFVLSERAQVVIRIYNMTGQLVRILNLGQKAPGAYVSKEKAAYWDGGNESGEKVSSGIYFYLMEAGSFRAAKKMFIIR